VIEIRPAQRYRTAQPGILTRHCFSAGAHYDPGNTAFGPVVGVDEHVVEPGAGFASHAHRGVEILTWVIDGALRHEDDSGRAELVEPGTVLHQVSGSGIRHSELNASSTHPLRFVQTTLLGDEVSPRCTRAETPVTLGAGTFAVVRGPARLDGPHVHLYVARGRFTVAGRALEPGGSLRATDESLDVTGAGELLVIRFGSVPSDS
jgi:hypothetical protein